MRPLNDESKLNYLKKLLDDVVDSTLLNDLDKKYVKTVMLPDVAKNIETVKLAPASKVFGQMKDITAAYLQNTRNKSEMAVGYCTLYGDMVGALAVIGDLVKTRVYQVCRWLNRDKEVIPHAILEKPPSAELRPDQKDTDSLPPYEILDPILEAYVERYVSPEQIARDNGLPLELVQQVVRLVERSEYKRQQAAPVLKVTSKSFGMGRRFPIAVKTQV